MGQCHHTGRVTERQGDERQRRWCDDRSRGEAEAGVVQPQLRNEGSFFRRQQGAGCALEPQEEPEFC